MRTIGENPLDVLLSPAGKGTDEQSTGGGPELPVPEAPTDSAPTANGNSDQGPSKSEEEADPLAAKVVRSSHCLTFLLREEEFALEILSILEIVEYQQATRIPSTPEWICGVINLRGKVIPVIDLAAKFGLGQSPKTRRSCIVVVEVVTAGEKTTIGVLVDAVHRVLDLSVIDVQEAPAFGPQIRVDFLAGICKVEERFVLLLDIHRILAAEELLCTQSISTNEVPLEEQAAEQDSDRENAP